MCMLYNKDPIIPFQMANKIKHSNVSVVTNHLDPKQTSCEVNSTQNEDLMETRKTRATEARYFQCCQRTN